MFIEVEFANGSKTVVNFKHVVAIAHHEHEPRAFIVYSDGTINNIKPSEVERLKKLLAAK